MSPVQIMEEHISIPKSEPKIPIGPITSGRGRRKSVTASMKDGHGCPMGFVRPDLTSRCTWKPNGTTPDLKKGLQGPHSIDKS